MVLKKFAFVWFILVLLVQLPKAYGQENSFAVGIEMGPSSASLYGNPILKENSATTIGFYSGWSFQYNFNGIFSLRTGFASELKGHTREFLATDQNGMPIGFGTGKIRYSYLTVPLLVRATFGQNIKYFVNLGSYAGYALKQETTVEVPQQPELIIEESETMKSYDYGFTAGAGLAFPVSNKLELSLELRNNLGLVNLSELPVFEDGSIKTNSLNLLIGIAYKFGESAQPAD